MDVVRLLLWLLPASRLKNRLLSLTPRWHVDPSCHLAPNVVWRVQTLTLGPGVRIAAGNVIRELREFDLQDRVEIGAFNWFSAAARYIENCSDADLRGRVRMESQSSLSSRHYVDASGGVVLGRLSIIGGLRSSLLSHSVDIRPDDLKLSPIRIGERSIVLTSCTLLPGATIGDRIAVAANSVVSGELAEAERLYAGSLARPVADLSGALFFRRTGTRIVAREREDALREEMRTSERHV